LVPDPFEPPSDEKVMPPAQNVRDPLAHRPPVVSDLGPSAKFRPYSLVRALRPRQWLKNVLVAAAPMAAGTLLTAPVMERVAIAFLAFCMMSGAVYLVNDVLDAANDRLHPIKRHRPVASGELSPVAAVVSAIVIASAATALTAILTWHLVVVLLLYGASSLAYSLGLKREPVVDLALVTGGFVLRAVAGGVATGVPLSEWFLLVASFGSLFMVAGKRYADVMLAEDAPDSAWEVVDYSPSYLRFVWSLAAGATVIGYALWAFQVGTLRGQPGLAQLSVAPFVFGMLRYAIDVDRGSAGSPEDVVLGDRVLLLSGLLWLVCFAAAADVG
jgi:decaprenyl-phosphate phosphoribosyltransferase